MLLCMIRSAYRCLLSALCSVAMMTVGDPHPPMANGIGRKWMAPGLRDTTAAKQGGICISWLLAASSITRRLGIVAVSDTQTIRAADCAAAARKGRRNLALAHTGEDSHGI